jgi:hypothetical protein
MRHNKIYVICDAGLGGIELLAPLRPEVVWSMEGMLEPNGDFVGVVYPNAADARATLEATPGVTVLPPHVSRGKLKPEHKQRLDRVGNGAPGIQANDDGYEVARKLHAHYKGLAAPGSRCCAALDPEA